ncbi:MAG: DNA replication/repair protein RecF [Ruminococcaceae bacterium]|nr:DNA replication/repair protein RecF [Oscillospiraceae bacterium]
MKIEKLKVENFRNIESASLSFSDGVNLLYGQNAQGKTNILEAVYYFARGKSFRGSSDGELKRFGNDGFFIEMTFDSNERRQSLAYRVYGKDKKKYRNGAEEERITDMIGHFRAVLFFPEHLTLVKEGPSMRRDFMNIGISQIKPMYLNIYSEYNKILENRNTILKNAQKGLYYSEEQLDIWSNSLAKRAAYINEKRSEYIKKISESAKRILYELSGGKEELSLEYVSDIKGGSDIEAQYRDILFSSREREIAAGCSLYGIHRDDVEIKINGISARSFASQGQQRSIVLALKMAEGEVCREYSGEYPVFLFDDVLSELDEKRRAYIMEKKQDRQILITACEKQGFDDSDVNVIKVEKGTYVSSYR